MFRLIFYELGQTSSFLVFAELKATLIFLVFFSESKLEEKKKKELQKQDENPLYADYKKQQDKYRSKTELNSFKAVKGVLYNPLYNSHFGF